MFTDEVKSSISWINLYQPESISPWILGKALQVGINYLNKVDLNYQFNMYPIN